MTIAAPTLSLPRRLCLALECGSIFIAVPAFFYFHATRWNIHLALWIVTLYALFLLMRKKGFSWHKMWHGDGLSAVQAKIATLRFCIATPLVILFTWYVVPGHLFRFPLQHPSFWLLVMILYPILSVLPQEVVFRSFFFDRYPELFTNLWVLIASSAFFFGFTHIVFHNPVSPIFSAIGGVMIAQSYSQHRSLKWATIEHAAYGCMVFTVGLGLYFLVGGSRLS